MWGESRVPGENPCRHGENVQTPQSGSAWESVFVFFLINVNETMLNKMALFDDLLYFKIAIIKYDQQFKGKQELKKKKNGNYYKTTKCKF